MNSERQSTGFLRDKLSYRVKEELRTINDVESEYWTLLLYYANVREKGQAIIKSPNARLRSNAWPAMSAFLKQAKTYYDSAHNLHHRAASLNFYYCFLNLAKATIICNRPELYNKVFVHGLSGRHSTHSNLFDRTSKVFTGVTNTGDYNAFDLLYNVMFETNLPRTVFLPIGTLMRYISEASYQNMKASSNRPKFVTGLYAIIVDSENKEEATFWPQLALKSFASFHEYPTFRDNFLSKFEQVSVEANKAREVYGIYAEEHGYTTYFQSKEVFPDSPYANVYFTASEYIKTALGNHLQPQYYADNNDFYINLPLRRTLQKPMNECLAIYIVIHHLSELVRYQPYYLEKLLTSKEAWVLDSIIDTCASMFMRGITPLITNIDYRVTPR